MVKWVEGINIERHVYYPQYIRKKNYNQETKKQIVIRRRNRGDVSNKQEKETIIKKEGRELLKE